MSAYRPQDHMFAKVVLASKPTNGAPPIITIHTRHPRIIHAEWMTHRVFSRNARSSRAVPVATMLKEIRETPFIPWHWGKNQKGMQADNEHNEQIRIWSKTAHMGHIPAMVSNFTAWLKARDAAVEFAEAFSEAGYHKQIANRLLEPFMWIDVLTTSTSWANFLHLRDHKDAEPHFRDLAQMVKEAIAGAEFQTLEPGQWHLPYVTSEDVGEVIKHLRGDSRRIVLPREIDPLLPKLSVARCARISYAPFDGDASIEKEIARYELLVGSQPLHASPAEHQAQVDELEGMFSVDGDWMRDMGVHEHEAGNLGPGYRQYRKMLPGEYVADAA